MARVAAPRSVVDVMLDVDVQTYLPDDLLVKMDIATMASSLEARSPLLDHELMEFAASLPRRAQGARARRRRSCCAARCAAGSPTRSSTRPSAASACRSATGSAASCASFARDVLLDRRAVERGWFRQDYVRELLDRHAAGVQDHSQGIWTLLMFELWHREFVDAPRVTDGAGRHARVGLRRHASRSTARIRGRARDVVALADLLAAARPMRRRSSGERTSRSSASVRASARPGATSRPSVPSSTSSGMPMMRVRHDRELHRHRLHGHDRDALGEARQAEDVRARVVRADVVLADGAERSRTCSESAEAVRDAPRTPRAPARRRRSSLVTSSPRRRSSAIASKSSGSPLPCSRRPTKRTSAAPVAPARSGGGT